MPFVYHYGQGWIHLAGKSGWESSLPQFIESAFDMIGCHRPTQRQQPQLPDRPFHKKARVTFNVEPHWEETQQSTRLEICGDSELVINWINGEARCQSLQHHIDMPAEVMEMLYQSWKAGIILPRESHVNWCRHVYRELNTAADAMATLAIEGQQCHINLPTQVVKRPGKVKICFDGGRRDNAASYGWVVYADFEASGEEIVWQRLASAATPLGDATTVEAELTGAHEALSWTLAWLESL